MSDTLARISEVAALQCSDVEPIPSLAAGTAHIRAIKDRPTRGRSAMRYIGGETLDTISGYLVASGHAAGCYQKRRPETPA